MMMISEVASQNGHLEVVKCLLEKGANINDKDNVRYISSIHSCPFDYSLQSLYMFKRSIACTHQYVEYVSSFYVTICCIHDHLSIHPGIHLLQYKPVLLSIA